MRVPRLAVGLAGLCLLTAVAVASASSDAGESCGCPSSQLVFNGRLDDCCCEYTEVDAINSRIGPILDSLGDTTFFRYFKVNIHRECPFWPENPQCSSRHCALDEEEDAEAEVKEWKERISRVDFSSPGFPVVQSCTSKERDFCVLEDTDPESTYINLQRNPETYTGFAGPSAHRIWRAIYEENCFTGASAENPMADQCVEARSFFRVISGMHASIAAHLAARYHNSTSNLFYFNYDAFQERLGDHPERIKNLYFAYAVVLRAVTKLTDYMANYQYATGNTEEDIYVQALVSSLVNVARQCPPTFDEQLLFNGADALSLKQEFKEHFRNISRVTDCVSCEKCRLWSKVQISGYGTAFKVLFSYDAYSRLGEVDYELTRNELVALLHTLRLLSESLRFVDKYRERAAAAVATGVSLAGANATAEGPYEVAYIVVLAPAVLLALTVGAGMLMCAQLRSRRAKKTV